MITDDLIELIAFVFLSFPCGYAIGSTLAYLYYGFIDRKTRWLKY